MEFWPSVLLPPLIILNKLLFITNAHFKKSAYQPEDDIIVSKNEGRLFSIVKEITNKIVF